MCHERGHGVEGRKRGRVHLERLKITASAEMAAAHGPLP